MKQIHHVVKTTYNLSKLNTNVIIHGVCTYNFRKKILKLKKEKETKIDGTSNLPLKTQKSTCFNASVFKFCTFSSKFSTKIEILPLLPSLSNLRCLPLLSLLWGLFRWEKLINDQWWSNLNKFLFFFLPVPLSSSFLPFLGQARERGGRGKPWIIIDIFHKA